MTRRPGVSVLFRAVAALGVVAALAACTPGFAPPPRPAPQSLPPGSPLLSRSLSDGDAWLRHYLMVGNHEAALALLAHSSGLSGDKLLRQLQTGVVLHQAGRYAESNRTFEWTEREADRRYTRSLSRAAGSLLINDRVLAYTPSRAELAVIPYYRMLNYLALGQLEAAVVEARKASALAVDRHGGGEEKRCTGEAFLQYFSGLVFGAAYEANDALVSFRRAERDFDACADPSRVAAPAQLGADLIHAARALGIEDVAHAAIARYGEEPSADAAAGELVVLVENGFTAHRAEESLYIPIFAGDTVGLAEDDDLNGMAERIGVRLMGNGPHGPRTRSPFRDVPLAYRDGEGDAAYVLKLAWPVLRLEASRAATIRLVVDGAAVDAPTLHDISALLARDLEAQRALLLTRMVARGLAKYVLAQQAEEKAEKQGGEAAAFLVGLLTNTAANVLERADTRSWSLLPDQISLVRVRLPAGEHRVRIEALGADGTVVAEADLGTVRVGAGQRLFLSHRVWGSHAGESDWLARLPPALRSADTLRP